MEERRRCSDTNTLRRAYYIEIISDLICICKGKVHCVVGSACFQNGLPCTELCTCAADIEKCDNAITSEFKHDYNEEEE